MSQPSLQATLIDGKAVAASVRAEITARAGRLFAETGRKPGLAVVLVGEDPASQVYVRNKDKAAAACGFHSVKHTLPADTAEADLLALVAALNADEAIHGILVQLPLPGHIDEGKVLRLIRPEKDVDGFHPVNVGLLATGDREQALVPCTPAGSLVLLKRTLDRPLAGLDAVVIGRSNIVGKPMAQLLLAESCTVTIAHSRTRNLPDVVRRADIVVAAVGRPEMVRGDWIKPGATVIDVGINRVPDPARGGDATRLVGDVAFAEAAAHAGAITPVPGGVGPMTIAMLMANTLTAARRLLGLAPEPDLF
ncbi:bifunctional methylenetetrahydrofolate dehydrogenase/methenyltetrahydrofolate cyclohydrolase FolD [Microvirga tunisiensis]|uniref:Bifunctional methylenetetrahydrofolate dehydrogenase/methenyltetrahydrofolate cyclohydrolase FolD n=2 Tax=Pannonibacter tanglangensis TaxID=2750084 RepID=A0ABW9ZCZ0_9HYPH|nr:MULTISPECIES: bifunctional methylenetetrahydrofolate dehydrogenase/methenyltetrahydrofolate cyclohydrolase FolD [unclassified Pannonibacter]NBN62712.1 bifunctional methylenetetrahydrofolate dehydrogenase/methenyltetrahydrofolate cyclohydrolase FolD [Pannonibacter sp. XCT-34]NBN78367.1 bifunctional methylenetetrahydrofolate dehydrogenase/methenyltetrahydrofolate cyclohydrolase FolD [Pannonibacter sp. XCT-53]